MTPARWPGIGVGRGAAIGRVVQLAPPVRPPVDEAAGDPVRAMAQVRTATGAVAGALRDRAAGTDATTAAVLEATALMALDPSLLADVEARVEQGVPVTHAVDAAVERFCAVLIAGGPVLADRVTDLRDVRDRLVARLLGVPEPGLPVLTGPTVVVAADLAPSTVAAFDPRLVVAIVLELGGPTSHTAILAAELDLPCLVRVAGARTMPTGALVAVDAAAGTTVLFPDASVRAAVARRRTARATGRTATSGPGATRDGTPVRLLANVGTVADAVAAAGRDVEGVGLFRTEVLFLDRTVAPSEAEQADAYAAVLAAFGERPVVVRTLDAGADKPLTFTAGEPEVNPALGRRGLRTAARFPDLLDDQLRALRRAADRTGTEPWVMAPMVATAAEARWFADRAHAAGLPTAGAMVEVPAAALRAGAIAATCDFLSIGTNDLTQFVMATDRAAGSLAELLDPWQPAVLDLIAATGAAGRSAGIPVGVCGEAARDPLLALVLVGSGATSLSMAAPAVPAVRSALSRTDLTTCTAMAAAARTAESAAHARAAVEAMADPDLLDGR
ncbi:putative PEP-binding protein [Nakamurella leprariae]|uniref:Phosphoenolpyruvate-protein phosphotransferase n=1 Tax=Nakamurella leprariae TaxID=2803911 RepID=A0A939C0A8_9ACTN|nr:putative PEP-binding protein [Nakamurella leprariae]MBM9465819.1 phosphoenolpyruvate--protein phosphotransferase [Nakamurella leprariae]